MAIIYTMLSTLIVWSLLGFVLDFVVTGSVGLNSGILFVRLPEGFVFLTTAINSELFFVSALLFMIVFYIVIPIALYCLVKRIQSSRHTA